MYLNLGEVVLVRNKAKRGNGDPTIYERDWNGNRVFTTDDGPSTHVGPAKPYGTLYFDANDLPCIIPDTWDEADASLARFVNDF